MRDLTDVEKRHIEQHQNCPACWGDLIGGPEGGACKNFTCTVCYRVFNLCFSFAGIFTGQLVKGDDYTPPPSPPRRRPQFTGTPPWSLSPAQFHFLIIAMAIAAATTIALILLVTT